MGFASLFHQVPSINPGSGCWSRGCREAISETSTTSLRHYHFHVPVAVFGAEKSPGSSLDPLSFFPRAMLVVNQEIEMPGRCLGQTRLDLGVLHIEQSCPCGREKSFSPPSQETLLARVGRTHLHWHSARRMMDFQL